MVCSRGQARRKITRLLKGSRTMNDIVPYQLRKEVNEK